MRGWKYIFHANRKQKKAGVAIIISEKVDLKIKITRDKEEHYIMIKGSIQEEDITIVNIYAMKQKILRRGGKNTQKNYTKKMFMTQIIMML